MIPIIGDSRSPVFLRDSFTDVDETLMENHTPEIGGAWLPYGFDELGWIVNNRYTRKAALQLGYYNAAQSADGNYDVTIVVASVTSNAVFVIDGKLVNPTPDEHSYYFTYAASTTTQQLKKNIGDVITTLATLVEALPTPPFTIRFQFRTSSPRIRLLVNEVEKMTSDDADLTGPGKVLLAITAGVANSVQYESVEAQNVRARIPITAVYRPAIAIAGVYDDG